RAARVRSVPVRWEGRGSSLSCRWPFSSPIGSNPLGRSLREAYRAEFIRPAVVPGRTSSALRSSSSRSRCAVLARAGFAFRAGFLVDGDSGVPFGLIATGAGGLVQLGDHAPDAVGQLFRSQAFTKTLDHQRK